MAEFSKLGPVVLVAVQLPILLIVPVGEGFLAFGTPEAGAMPGFIGSPIEPLAQGNIGATAPTPPGFITFQAII